MILKCYMFLHLMTAKAMVSTSKQPRVSFANAGGRVAHGRHGNPEYNALWETEGIEVQDVSLQLIQGKLSTILRETIMSTDLV